MTQLSPAAQAVLDAFHSSSDGHYEDGVWMPHTSEQIAAALRALADQVVPQPRIPYDSCCDVHAAAIRAEIHAIAAELECNHD